MKWTCFLRLDVKCRGGIDREVYLFYFGVRLRKRQSLFCTTLGNIYGREYLTFGPNYGILTEIKNNLNSKNILIEGVLKMSNYYIGDLTKNNEVSIYDLGKEGSNEVLLVKILDLSKERNVIVIKFETRGQKLSFDEQVQVYEQIIPVFIQKMVEFGFNKEQLAFNTENMAVKLVVEKTFPQWSAELLLL